MKALLLAAGLAMLLGAAAVSAAPPQKGVQKGAQQTIAIDKLPAAVTAAVLKAYPNSTIVSAATFTRGKQVGYDLSVKPTPDAQPVSVMALADGTIRAAGRGAPAAGTPPPAKGQRRGGAASSLPERPIVEVKDLPKAVTNAIKDAYPKDTILSAVRISTGPPVIYELSLNDVASLMPLRVVVTSEGQFQKR
jgi:hypothetical protein